MQIHDLNTKALTNPAYVAFDDGTDTYKADFKAEIDNAAADAVADADLTDNTVAFTSGDAASPTAWTSVSQITTNSTLATLFNRISTMVKNVRYLWNLIGSSSFSNVASTLSGAIGNTALTTTAQTLSGAIAEHESDISTLNGKSIRVALSSATSAITVTSAYLVSDPVRKTIRIYIAFRSASDISSSTTIVNIPSNYRPAGNMPLIGFFSTSSIYGVGFYGTCDANGNVRQNLGNTVREGILIGEYLI